MSTPIHILFIEDSEAEIQPILQELHQNCYVVTYQRVDSAVMMQFALQQHPWDIAFCKYLLPGFSALEALSILKKTQPDLPCIVLSEIASESIAVEMMRSGASDYCLKEPVKSIAPVMVRVLQQAEIRHAKRHSEASALQLAAIVESTEDAIISTDLNGRVLTWNSGAENLYGYTAAEVCGEPLVPLIQPDTDALLSIPHEAHMTKVIDCRQVTQRRKTGELIEVLLTVSLIKNTDGTVAGFAVIARDMSERQVIQRMQNEFISVINHELRTPLASLQGSIELLLTGKLGDLSEQGLRMLQIAANNVDRLVSLTSNILDLEELTSGKATLLKQSHDLGQILSQAATERQSMAHKHGIQLIVKPSSIQLSLDPNRILQVLHHLITNAIQFSPAGGRVWLDVELQKDRAATSSPFAVVRVKDEGQGIPVEQLETIFEQFQQGDASDSRRQGGVGLGLAICRSIAHQHHGNVWVESSIGQGSTFCLSLPVQRVAVQTYTGHTRSN